MKDYQQYKSEVYKIIGAAMTVHSELGWGLLEPIYQEALHIELNNVGMDNEREIEIPCYYKQYRLEKKYKVDIVVGDILVELKSCKELIPAHRAQLFNYLRLTKKPVGVLINFGCSSLHGERYGYDQETNECYLLDRAMEVIPKSVEWCYEVDNNIE